MAKKEMLRQYERTLMDKIAGLGLVYRVEHKQYTMPKTKNKWNNETKETEVIEVIVPYSIPLHTEKGTIMIIGESCVSLYYRNDGLKGRELEREVPVGIGFSWCSVKDTFDRQIGRVKAMDRALKSFMNSESCHIQK